MWDIHTNPFTQLSVALHTCTLCPAGPARAASLLPLGGRAVHWELQQAIAHTGNSHGLTSIFQSCLHHPYDQLPAMLPLGTQGCCYTLGSLCLHGNLSGTGRLSLLCFGRHPTCSQAFNRQSRNDSDGETETWLAWAWQHFFISSLFKSN